ncbi:MAG: nitronate monooxygenase [Acinetobacter sp.]
MSLRQQLQIKYPLFLAPMAGVSSPQLAAEVSNAGGLGALGLGASHIDAAKAAILDTQKLTRHPFQVNFFCHQPHVSNELEEQEWINALAKQFKKFNASPPTQLHKIYQSFIENEDYLNLVLDLKPKAVSFHFGIPSREQIDTLKRNGIITMASVTQLSEAQQAENDGIDILIAQGIEAGGHRGIFNPLYDPAILTKDLIILLKQYIKIPIVAAGGIMNGQDVKAYLHIGADAAQLGTAFVQCKESLANDAYRHALFTQTVTQITDSISGRPARGLFNHWHEWIDIPARVKHAGYPQTYDLAKQLHSIASQAQDHGFGAFWAGSHVAKIRKMDARELMSTLIHEADL